MQTSMPESQSSIMMSTSTPKSVLSVGHSSTQSTFMFPSASASPITTSKSSKISVLSAFYSANIKAHTPVSTTSATNPAQTLIANCGHRSQSEKKIIIVLAVLSVLTNALWGILLFLCVRRRRQRRRQLWRTRFIRNRASSQLYGL
jgi:hypothetical protein